MRQIMRSSLDYAGSAQLCGRSPIMREIMRAHNRIIPRSLVETDGWLINQAVVSHEAIAVEKSHRAAAAAGKKARLVDWSVDWVE